MPPREQEKRCVYLVAKLRDRDAGGSVTFAIDDTDATPATRELGGDILVPPFDIGNVRTAVLSDPEGTVSR